eukprot:TRINITY_DN9807_c0_g1_i1.p1 TRINITY_DN9807_c0_g1~~TRINITY_DN9807_c0_g1_i1.p1  ORF type:complete len:510 (+),score=86.28 TRINITY_DN9807_c0_g1_i1:190-1719(+)
MQQSIPSLFTAVGTVNYVPTEEDLVSQLFPVVQNVMATMLENEFDESALAVTKETVAFIQNPDKQLNYRNVSDELLRGLILESFVHWVHKKTLDLDYLVEMTQSDVANSFIGERLRQLKTRFRQHCGLYPGIFAESATQQQTQEMAEFIYCVVCELLGSDSACLGSLLAGLLLQQTVTDLLYMFERPTLLLGLLVRKMQKIQSKMSKVVMSLYEDIQHKSLEESKMDLLAFFQYYTVDTSTGMFHMHETPTDATFVNSHFRVYLVSSYGSLLEVLCHLEAVWKTACRSGKEIALAVDFEGERLCRNGPLRLLQMSCSDDPTLVYVLDVFVLGQRTFTLQTPNGTCMKSLLENEQIRKVWFDPRNDVDALYHQFRIMPTGIFDLQLAEVATRRMRNYSVQYVSGLNRCIAQCTAVESDQKAFANRINDLGKRMFEPQNGGTYEVFRKRPLNPVILVYAAHDSRYMFALYEQYTSNLDESWIRRVLQAGTDRAILAFNEQYVAPGSEAPNI